MSKLRHDWETMTLEKVAATTPGSFVDGPFGSNLKTDEYTSEGIRLIQLQNIGEGEWLDENKRFISPKKFKELIRHAAYPGDLAIAKMAEPVARTCLLPKVSDKFVVVADCIKLTPDKSRHDSKYLVYAINYHDVRHQAECKSIGTTRKRINLTVLKTLEIWAPPLAEQQKIAGILDASDRLITLTDRHIAKLKQARAGLLHDLLTRGIDERGELRDPVAHPEQFKETGTAIGRIPKDWKVQQMRSVALIKYGISDAVDQSLSTGIPTVTLPCVNKAGDLNLDKDLLALSARTRVKTEDILQIGDLLFNWRNGSQEHLGKTAYFNSLGEYTHVGFLLRIRTNPEVCNARYLWWRINLMKSQGFFLRAKSQVNNTFNSEELNNVLVVLPPIVEQERIVNALEPLQKRIDAKQVHMDKLKTLKKGLMADLLTGRVRVKLDITKEG